MQGAPSFFNSELYLLKVPSGRILLLQSVPMPTGLHVVKSPHHFSSGAWENPTTAKSMKNVHFTKPGTWTFPIDYLLRPSLGKWHSDNRSLFLFGTKWKVSFLKNPTPANIFHTSLVPTKPLVMTSRYGRACECLPRMHCLSLVSQIAKPVYCLLMRRMKLTFGKLGHHQMGRLHWVRLQQRKGEMQWRCACVWVSISERLVTLPWVKP